MGSIYISTSSSNPALLFGGNWNQIQDRFLLSAGSSYNGGDTGGETTHTLSEAEMPSHTHTGTTNVQSANHTHSIPNLSGSTSNSEIWFTTGSYSGTHTDYATINSDAIYSNSFGYYTWKFPKSSHSHSVTTNASNTGKISTSHNHSFTTASTGLTSSHNNMPPYLVVYVWERIS